MGPRLPPRLLLLVFVAHGIAGRSLAGNARAGDRVAKSAVGEKRKGSVRRKALPKRAVPETTSPETTAPETSSPPRRPASRSQSPRIELPVAEGTYVLRFDPANLDRKTAEAAARVSPYADIPGLDTLLEACDPKDKTYRSCDASRPGSKAFLYNATVNVSRAVKRLRDLKALKVPPELGTVHKFLLKNAYFYVWLLKTRLEFLKTARYEVLKREFSGVKPAKSCELAIERIEKTEAAEDVFRLTRSDWHNCVNHVFNQNVGKYPQAAWEAFLKKYHLDERLENH